MLDTIEHIKNNLKIKIEVNPRRIFGLKPKKVIKLYLDNECISECEL